MPSVWLALFPLAGPIIGVLSGVIAILARGVLGYRRTSGYLAFLGSKVPGVDPRSSRIVTLLVVEVGFYALVGLGYLLALFAVGITVGFPPFYGALSYSQAAVTALATFSVAFGLGVALLMLFFSEPTDREAYLGEGSLLGLFVGTITFGIAARATVLMVAYPRTHREVGSRAATRLPFGWALDVLPYRELLAAFLVLFLVATVVRHVGGPVRPWHALLLVGVGGFLLPVAVLWLSVSGPLDPLWANDLRLLLRVRAFGLAAILLAGVDYNVGRPTDGTG